MVTITLRDDDAKLWLKVIQDNEVELGPAHPDGATERMKAELQCALSVCACDEPSSDYVRG